MENNISTAEIEYANVFARYAPFPGSNYAESAINKLAKAHLIFKNKYEGKKYSLTLSNNEEFHFEIKSKNIAHLLGIDYKNLSSDAMKETVYDVLGIDNTYDNHPAYDYLTAILERAEDVIKNDGTRGKKKILNYYKSMIKSSAFSKLSDFEDFKFGVVNFDNKKYVPVCTENFSPRSTKYIFTDNGEILLPYSMLGFVEDNSPDNQKGINVPETILLTGPKEFGRLLDRLELLLPISLLVNDENELSKETATALQTLRLLQLYKNIEAKYGAEYAYTNIFGDCYSIVERDIEKEQKQNAIKDEYKKILAK